MKIRVIYMAIMAFALLMLPTAALADSWVLGDWSAIIDGTTYNPPALPGSVNSGGFDFNTGLGSLIFTFNTAGPNYGGVYFYNYYDAGFGDVSDAYAGTSGTVPSGVSYQFGWPGVPDGSGNTVFDYFAANNLQGSNSVPAYLAPPSACCSVAMAEINNFTLHSGETGTLTFKVDTAAPGSGFYLQVTDHDSQNSIYLTENLQITPAGGPPPTSQVPEPGTCLLLGTGIGALSLAYRRKTNEKS